FLHVNPAILPPPSQVARKWVEYLLPGQPYEAGTSRLSWIFSGELPHDAVATLMRVFVGFIVGAGIALPLGLWMGARDRVYPRCTWWQVSSHLPAGPSSQTAGR